MEKLLCAAAVLLTAFIIPAQSQAQDTNVSGYYRNDGSYVQPYHRSAPDGNPYNNYSTQGNINPYNGRTGTVTPPQPKPYEGPRMSPPVYRGSSYGRIGNEQR